MSLLLCAVRPFFFGLSPGHIVGNVLRTLLVYEA